MKNAEKCHFIRLSSSNSNLNSIQAWCAISWQQGEGWGSRNPKIEETWFIDVSQPNQTFLSNYDAYGMIQNDDE